MRTIDVAEVTAQVRQAVHETDADLLERKRGFAEIHAGRLRASGNCAPTAPAAARADRA